MTDRELLELAAKAAGIEDVSYYLDDFLWNPLDDDGDALRLAVRLKMRIGIDSLQERFVIVMSNEKLTLDTHEKIKDDPYAATRRAIVRAAAEIGKEMT